jgi:hypothetical protein
MCSIPAYGLQIDGWDAKSVLEGAYHVAGFSILIKSSVRVPSNNQITLIHYSDSKTYVVV